jgi:membrane protease YdiL (CAAX protease family)
MEPVPPPQIAGVLPYSSVPLRRKWSIGEIATWAIVLSLSVLLAVLAAVAQMLPADRATSDSSLRMASRIAVGVHLLSSSLANPPANPAGGGGLSYDSELLNQLDGQASTSEDRFRVAIVAGELLGRDAALTRMNALAAQDWALESDVRTAADLYGGRAVAADTLDAFRSKYEWFADLLTTVGKPVGDQDRHRAILPVYRTMAALVGLVVLGPVLAIAGLVLLLIAIVRLGRGRLKCAFSPGDPPGTLPVADRRTYLFGFACYLALMILAAVAVRLVLELGFPAGSELGLSLVVTLSSVAFGLAVPFMFGQTWRQWRLALGFYTRRGIWREIGAGLLGYFAGIPLVLIGILLMGVLSAMSGMKGSHPINEDLGGSAGELILAFVLACVVAPLTEELMFRGALFAHLREHFGWWISAPLVAFIFAVIHPQGWVALPALGSLALVFAAIREWRGSIVGCMAAHALHNGLTLTLAVLLLR